mgnify:FL=1
MKKSKGPSVLDFIVLGTPLVIGTAFILPFVAFDVVKELIREKRKVGR